MVWKPSLISMDFDNFFFVFSVFNEQFEKQYQTFERVFHEDSKHLKVSLKKFGYDSFFQTPSLCLDILMKYSSCV